MERMGKILEILLIKVYERHQIVYWEGKEESQKRLIVTDS